MLIHGCKVLCHKYLCSGLCNPFHQDSSQHKGSAMEVKINNRSGLTTLGFGDVNINAFIMVNGRHYMKVRPYHSRDNAYDTESHEFATFAYDTQVHCTGKKLEVVIPRTTFNDIEANGTFIMNRELYCRYGTSDYSYKLSDGKELYLNSSTEVEKADVTILVNQDKTPNRFKESMLLLNMVWKVSQQKIPLIKALRQFAADNGFSFGLKEAKDWVEANLK